MPEALVMAERFASQASIRSVLPSGTGNINDTWLVLTQDGARFILQRLNPTVFPEPARILANLRVVNDHLAQKTRPPNTGRWELPSLIPTKDGTDFCLGRDGACWRALTFIEQSFSLNRLNTRQQAFEAGRALGLFHALIHDLPVSRLFDTLPGFHVTPRYLAAYRASAAAPNRPDLGPAARFCAECVERGASKASILEEAARRGELRPHPIHGDPKPANILFDTASGKAVSLIDLDTVKPGLLHYDIGDCLRACCNRADEDAPADTVSFDLDFCAALLEGYLPQVASFFEPADYRYIPAAAHLISFELGLRFFTDHLAGDIYFKVRRKHHNLDRAMAQFTLCRSIEAQEPAICALVSAYTSQ